MGGLVAPAFADERESFEHAVLTLQETYGANVTADQLYRAALAGVTQQLDTLVGRPGHAVLSPTEHAAAIEWHGGQRYGLAAEFIVVPGQGIVITDIYSGGPAANAGLGKGDVIVAMNDHPFTGLPAELILAIADQQASPTVVLDVRRAEGLRRISVTRGPWRLDTARVDVYGDVAVLRLPFFGPGTVSATVAALSKLPSDTPIVLDLRDNEGGQLDAMVSVAELFLPARTTVALVEAANGTTRAVKTGARAPSLPAPRVVLVDHGTAAVAEAFVAALRQHTQAPVVGGTTAGQDGLVAWVRVDDQTFLQVFSDGLRDPQGRTWASIGITPDVVSQPGSRPMPVSPGQMPPDVQLDAAVHLARRTIE